MVVDDRHGWHKFTRMFFLWVWVLLVVGLYQAPHGDEEGDGEIYYEAVVDAEGGVAVAYGVGDDGEGGVH